MKIGYLTSEINPKTGWGRYSSDLIFGIKALGHNVVILKEKDDGLEGIKILKGGLDLFRTAFKIRKYLFDCDIIHALDGYPYGLIAAISNLKLKKKLFITGVGTYAVAPLYNFSSAHLLKWSYKRADYLVTISNFTKDEILKKVDVHNISVIKPGLQFEKFNRPRSISQEDFIISVGALKDRKGYHISIPAFSLVKKQFPKLKYIIVGDQNDRNYFNHLNDLVKKNNIANDVVFLSNISDQELANLYSKAKLFVLTSVNYNHHFEGFGIVFLEAAACGLPVVGTLNNGIADAISVNINGYLVPQNDIKETAKAIHKILIDTELTKKFSQASYKFAENNDSAKAVSAYEKLYKSLV